MNAPSDGLFAHPVLSCARALEWERDLLRGDAGLEWAAMQRAGRGIAASLLADAGEAGGISADGRLLVLCGRGHNGGDALIAAHGILDARRQATALVLVVPDFAALRPLVRRALEDLVAAHRERLEFDCVSRGPDGADAARVRPRLAGARFDLCLDGLFGMQFRPPLRAPADWLIALVNEHPGIRIRAAVDVPSGIGDASDRVPFRADFTYATGVVKAPVLEPALRFAVGRVRYVDIGFFESGESPDAGQMILTRRVLEPLSRLRAAVSDKRSFGHLFVVTGSRTLPGAVLMAVEAAVLSGVGLVTAFVPESVVPGCAARVPEAMWVPMPETPSGGLALEGRASVIARATRCTGLLAGPGLGREHESLALVADLLRTVDVPAVLDGDALQPELLSTPPGGRGAPLVLTPHAGEFARLVGNDALDDEALRGAAARHSVTIALKGAPTRVSAGETVFFAPFGGPALARGGSGDVLAGLVAGQLAAGAEPLVGAARGVVWHGMAADRLARWEGQTSTRVTRLPEHLHAVLHEEVARA